MSLSALERAERSRHASIRRHHPDDPSLAEESLRRLKTLRAESFIRELLASGPSINLTDRRRLARLLTGAER